MQEGDVVKHLWFALLLSACGGWLPPEPVPVDGDACERYCAVGERLGCGYAEPTPNGTPCVQVCYDTEATGWTTCHPACVADHATSCAEADRLSASGCK